MYQIGSQAFSSKSNQQPLVRNARMLPAARLAGQLRNHELLHAGQDNAGAETETPAYPAALSSSSDSDQSSDSDDEPRPADHPDYFGRGWQPAKAAPTNQTGCMPAAAGNGTDASSRPSRLDQGSNGSDSDDQGAGRQPLKEVSTKRQMPLPPPPPEWVSQAERPPPRSGLPSIEVDFTDIKLAPGIPARHRIPEEAPSAPPPEERKLNLFGP